MQAQNEEDRLEEYWIDEELYRRYEANSMKELLESIEFVVYDTQIQSMDTEIK